MKLQDAYASESNAVGSWKLIGYKMAPNTNFTYSGNEDDGTVAVSGLSGKLGWKAINNIAMNDCTTSSPCEWNLKMSEGNDGNGVAYAAYESSNAQALTPSFCKIGGNSTCTGTAAE